MRPRLASRSFPQIAVGDHLGERRPDLGRRGQEPVGDDAGDAEQPPPGERDGDRGDPQDPGGPAGDLGLEQLDPRGCRHGLLHRWRLHAHHGSPRGAHMRIFGVWVPPIFKWWGGRGPRLVVAISRPGGAGADGPSPAASTCQVPPATATTTRRAALATGPAGSASANSWTTAGTSATAEIRLRSSPARSGPPRSRPGVVASASRGDGGPGCLRR